MSVNTYMKIISHIVKDSETSISTADKVYSDLDKFIRHVYGKDDDVCGDDLWVDFSRTAEKDYDEITAHFGADVSGFPEAAIKEIISVIDTLDNGSYGMLLSDTEYGVTCYSCYGDAEFAEVTENEVKDCFWGTDGCLSIETKMPVEDLALLLNCDTDAVSEEAWGRGEELAEKLLPDFFMDLYEENKKMFPGSYGNEGPFSDYADADDEDGVVSIFLDFRSHDFSTNQLMTIKKAFDDGTLKDWTLRQTDRTEEDGVFTNVMINQKINSVVVFKTSAGCFESIKFMTMKPLK